MPSSIRPKRHRINEKAFRNNAGEDDDDEDDEEDDDDEMERTICC